MKKRFTFLRSKKAKTLLKSENSGFTLIEILIVITITAVLGIIFASSLVQTLRGQKKVQVVEQSKQDGQVVLDRITNEVRQAEYVVCVDSNTSLHNWDTLVLFRQGTYTRFRFYPAGTGISGYNGGNPSHNGFITLDYPYTFATPTFMPLTPTPAPAVAGEDLCNENQVFDSNLSYLTDTDPNNGVSVSYDTTDPINNPSPYKIFFLNQAPGYSDSVTIKFRINSGVGAGGAFENSVGSGITPGVGGVLYQTTATLRGRS